MLLLAALDGMLKTLLIILLVYFALRFSWRLLMPYLMKYITKKAGQKMEQAFKGFQGFSDAQNAPQEDAPPGTKKSKNTVGEYIDFEEID